MEKLFIALVVLGACGATLGCAKKEEGKEAPEPSTKKSEVAPSPPAADESPTEAATKPAVVPQTYMEEREAQKSECSDFESCLKECEGGLSSACKVAGDQISVLAEKSGNAPDDTRRMKLYEKGCDAGSHSSCFTLALQLAKGDGIPEDDRSAAQIRQKSCDAGYKAACGALALNFAYGEGVKQDFSKARALAGNDCESGGKRSCGLLEAIQHGQVPQVVDIERLLVSPKAFDGKVVKLEGAYVSRVGPRRGMVRPKDGGSADTIKAKPEDSASKDVVKEWLSVESGTWTRVHSLSGRVAIDGAGDPTIHIGEMDVD